MDNSVTFDEMNELLDEIYRSGGKSWVEIDGQPYYTDWEYGVVAIEFFIRMLKNRKGDNDATLVRHSVAEDADEIIEHVINANMLNMPYHVYSELFDAVDGLGVEIENLQAENAKLREQIHWLKRGDVLHVLTDQELADQQKHEREMQASITALDAENAKLRELVAVIWRFTGTACKKYPRLFDPAAQGGQIMQLNMIEVFEQRMHELGIEV